MVHQLTAARLTPEGVEVVFDDGVAAVVSGRWLRDHGDDPTSRDPHTGQRLVDTFALPTDLMPSQVSPSEDGTQLTATWPGPLTTHVAAATVHACVSSPIDEPTGPVDWRLPASIDTWSAPTATANVSAPAGQIRKHGWVVVDDVARGHESVGVLAATLGGVQSTIFGGIWDLSAEVTDHADSAYNSTFLGPHTDATYLDDAPRLQVFVCQDRKGTGGESILVDGFAAAVDLREVNPEASDLLAGVAVPGRYVEPGVDCRAARPTLRLDADDELEQISLNNLDRAPFWIPGGGWDRWLDAYAAFNRLLVDERRWLRMPVRPGQALVIDNWRILHGREAFTGTRRFLGCYVSNQDFKAAA